MTTATEMDLTCPVCGSGEWMARESGTYTTDRRWSVDDGTAEWVDANYDCDDTRFDCLQCDIEAIGALHDALLEAYEAATFM